jgi:hypothetical protein
MTSLQLIALLLLMSMVSREENSSERLFTITRKKNDNIVCYDANLTNNKLHADEPLSVYWIIPSKNNQREELNRFERRRAYGFDIKQQFGNDSLEVTLKPLPKVLRITQRRNKWVAVAQIDSADAIVSSVYVMADESGAFPKVQWVKITGTRSDNGKEISETIKQ